MKTKYLIIFILLLIFQLQALTLKECLDASERNYAVSSNIQKISEIDKMEKGMYRSGNYPQLYFQSSYHLQSESTEVELTGLPFAVEFPEQSRAGWSLALQMRQVIYDGGIINRKTALKSLQNAVQKQGIEGMILERKLNTAAYYYGIMISKRQKEILQIHTEDLTLELERANAGLKAGLIDQTCILQLEEQRLKLNEEMIELEHKEIDYTHRLEILTGEKDIDFSSEATDVNEVKFSTIAKSPELEVFKIRKKIELEQTKISGSGLLPGINFAAMAGYGTPGYDIFSDDPHDYYQASINLNWQVWDWNKRKKKIKLHKLQSEVIDRELEDVEEQLQLRIDECDMEISKYDERLEILKERSLLLKKISENYASKLTAGTVSSSEYLQQFNGYKSCELEISAMQLQKEFTSVKKLLITGGSL